jgi:ribonuclease R
MAPRRDAERGEYWVGRLQRKGRHAVAVPLFSPGPQIPVKGRIRPQDDEIAWVRERGRSVQVIERLGSAGNGRDVCEALALDRLGRRGFTPELEAEAGRLAGSPGKAIGSRTDLTSLPTFTVDPSTARDFDDAVSAVREGDSIRLWVHIADVSAWVRPGSDLDREAARRGNSVYIPTSVEPMLPLPLSAGVCSLAPDKQRFAVTTEFLLSGSGEVSGTSFYRSTVESDARLDYDQLDRVFSGEESPPEVVAETIDLARQAAAALTGKRGELRLEVTSTEPEFEFDSAGNPVSATSYVETEAHLLIEQLMIAVNEQVASFLQDSRTPTIYRVHESPDPDRIERLFAQLESLELPSPPFTEGAGPTEAGRMAVEASRLIATEALRRGHGGVPYGSLVLRSLKPAQYSAENIGHAGLGSTAYSHFTSPIRRYPDLLVHRGLLERVGAGEEGPDSGTAAEVALHCSSTEREAASIERDADDICAAFLLERELFESGWKEVFEGEVSGVIPAGAFVNFGGKLGDVYEGFLPARKIGGRERYTLNEVETALVGEKSGDSVRFGDPVSITVERVNAPLGRVDLTPVPD